MLNNQKPDNRIKHGQSKHRLYYIWKGMKSRVFNSNSKNYSNYGGREIKICDRWLDINNFIADMYPAFKDGLSIDRIDNDKGYELSNCRWANKVTQSQNQRLLCKNNKSGYRGVHFRKNRNAWISKINVNSKSVYLGYFKSALEAAMAYDIFVRENKLEHPINGVLL